MANNDKSSLNNVLISTNNNQIIMTETVTDSLSYRCRLCEKCVNNQKLTCSECINRGEFCSSKHEKCSNAKRDFLSKFLNDNDDKEFQQHSNQKTIHLKYSDQMFLLKKFNGEKKVLESKLETNLKSFIGNRQKFDEIQVRKVRVNRVHQALKQLKERIEQKKQLNITTRNRINDTRLRITEIKRKCEDINQILNSSYDSARTKITLRTKHDNLLNKIRQASLNEVYKFIFPIQRSFAIEKDLATRIKALSNAQKTSLDESSPELMENEEILTVSDYRYQIVNSCLPNDIHYQIENLPLLDDIQPTSLDPDSPQSVIFRESYEFLSALSHACQLINIVAFYLYINLPFRLHRFEFNTDTLKIDCLRSRIAKLNTNIVSCCLSQDIPIESENVSYTLANLFKLLTTQNYLCRPKPVVYSEDYINMIEKEIGKIDRDFTTDYWFDDVINPDEADNLNMDEWEAVLQDDLTIYEHNSSLESAPKQQKQQQQTEAMSSSIEFFRNKGSVLIDSFARNFKSSK